MPEPRNYDFDRLYRRPTAWRKAKEVFGVVPGDPESSGQLGRAMLALEAHCREHGGCPRFLLMLAVHTFLAMSDAERTAALFAWGRAEDARNGKAAPAPQPPPPEAPEPLPEAERQSLDADFRAFVDKVFGPDRPAA